MKDVAGYPWVFYYKLKSKDWYGSIFLRRKPISKWVTILILRVKNLSVFFSGWLKKVNPVWRVECSKCKDQSESYQLSKDIYPWDYGIIR